MNETEKVYEYSAEERKLLDVLCMEMIAHDKGDPRRVHHFLKVNAFAGLIARGEGFDPHTRFIAEAAGYIHDIGIRLAEEKYGYQNGRLQEELGPEAARAMLERCGFSGADTERICWLIARHHTYSNIDGDDYRVLVEADFLVNLYERGSDRSTAEETYKKIFRTETGKKICQKMLLEERSF